MRKGMKQKSLTKRVSTVLLATALTISTFPQFVKEVHAAELPDSTKFATAEELKTFDTNDQDGKNPAKVYFGDNNHQWWIAGSTNADSMTLFAASPLATGQQFEPKLGDKTYSEDWNCDYASVGGSNPTEVFQNHYGASPLRTTLQGLETSYFTGEEQALMKNTTVYTDDTKNGSVYSTTDKLYLAYGNFKDDQYITVGANPSGSLNNGLRIDKDYWGNSGAFWLRTPYLNSSAYALVALPERFVLHYPVEDADALVPAFELNLSSVIFASAAPAATSEGALATIDAFTLRYKSENLGSALVSYDKSRVKLINVPENTYLVVQNNSGAWAKKIISETSVTPSEVDQSLTSFANCKVWLETTDSNERMTYATLATEEKETSVNIIASEGLNITSNNGEQEVVPNTAITDIIVEVTDGYYLPDDYISNLQGQLNGLSVTKTDNGFKISGIPTSDVSITLPAATVLQKAPTPEIKTTQTANSITVEVTNYKSDFGEIEYNWDNTGWTNQNKLVNSGANKAHTLSVRFTGAGIYQMSDEKTVDVSTTPATYEISIPMTAAADDSKNMISIDGSKDFDLGYNGKINVKIQNTDTMNNGVLSLTRENGNNETITSKLLVGGKPFTDLSQNVAAFTNKSDPSVPFVFQRPATSNILAGTYKGTVVFDISYSED